MDGHIRWTDSAMNAKLEERHIKSSIRNGARDKLTTLNLIGDAIKRARINPSRLLSAN